MKEFNIGEGGRVKMAGGSIDTYYCAAQPMLENGISGALEARNNFAQLCDNPTEELKAAFFPAVGDELRQRLRGAGVYRHLRMDQGPGGNFTAFEVSETDTQYGGRLLAPRPHALLEESVRVQLAPHQELGCLATAITAAYADSDLGKTFGLMNQFKHKAEEVGVELPHTGVGSRSGFFLINPTETTDSRLTADVEPAVEIALEHARAYAATARKYIREGMSYQEAVRAATKAPASNPDDSSIDDLLYFQPDCFVDTTGKVAVERINFPDVGFFLTEIESDDNVPLKEVVRIVKSLQKQVGSSFERHINSSVVTIVVKDEAIESLTDMLEVNEARALEKILGKLGFEVTVIGVSQYEDINQDSTILILNPDVNSPAFGSFTEKVIREDIPTFPDPLLKTFEYKSSTLETFQVSGKHLDAFLNHIRPKNISKDNAERVHADLFRMLSKGGISENVDIMYAFVPGQKTPVPLFRYSLHSFFQLYNAVERSKKNGANVSDLYIRAIPFQRETAVFGDHNGKRLAAFRTMFIKAVL